MRIIIEGDRGVGKTQLAVKILAFLMEQNIRDVEVITTACEITPEFLDVEGNTDHE